MAAVHSFTFVSSALRKNPEPLLEAYPLSTSARLSLVLRLRDWLVKVGTSIFELFPLSERCLLFSLLSTSLFCLFLSWKSDIEWSLRREGTSFSNFLCSTMLKSASLEKSVSVFRSLADFLDSISLMSSSLFVIGPMSFATTSTKSCAKSCSATWPSTSLPPFVTNTPCPGRSLVEIGRFDRNPGPTISASLHSSTVPKPSNLTLNFFSIPENSIGLDLIAATTAGRQNPSTHLTVTLAPIIDLFGILFVLAISTRIFGKNFSVSRVVGAVHVSGSAKSLLLLGQPRTPATGGLFVVG